MSSGRPPNPSGSEFTLTQLAQYDGSVPGRPVLIGYRGRVYDVTDSLMWMNGWHYWHRAGQDITKELAEAPHTEVVLRRVPMVGILKGTK